MTINTNTHMLSIGGYNRPNCHCAAPSNPTTDCFSGTGAAARRKIPWQRVKHTTMASAQGAIHFLRVPCVPVGLLSATSQSSSSSKRRRVPSRTAGGDDMRCEPRSATHARRNSGTCVAVGSLRSAFLINASLASRTENAVPDDTRTPRERHSHAEPMKIASITQ